MVRNKDLSRKYQQDLEAECLKGGPTPPVWQQVVPKNGHNSVNFHSLGLIESDLPLL